MLELIAQIILIGSIIAITLILAKKIPVLVGLPKPPEYKIEFWPKIKTEIQKFGPFKSLFLETFLQKILLKFKIIILKTENKISFWLKKLNYRSQKKKNNLLDNYWEGIKKSSKGDLKKDSEDKKD